MTRQRMLRNMAIVLACAGIQSCADNPTTKLPSDDELKATIKVDQQKWQEGLKGYVECLYGYAERMFKSTASAGDIADGAASSCRSFAEQYAVYQMHERTQTMILYRKGYTPGEMEREMRTAPTVDKIEEELAGSNRNATVDYVLKLRAKFGG